VKAYPPVYILRHGQTEWNSAGRLQGRIDSPLTDLGRRQAEAQREVFASRDLAGFRGFSSPQGRAFHTAALVLVGLVPIIDTDPRLVEIGVGTWEGLHRSEIVVDGMLEESDEGALDLYARAPCGEGFAALRKRCESFLGDLEAPAIIVTHGITSRMLRLVLLDRDISELSRLPGGQGVVFRIADGRQERLEQRP
jgi:probable phosphoglycerate mutase